MKDQAQRTTAMGFYTRAKQMHKAAEILMEAKRGRVMLPTYYLLGHSVELALKSVLFEGGVGLKRLKKDFGHDLSKAAHRVIALNLSPVSNTVSEHLPQINGLNRYYMAKDLEYPVTGTMSRLPEQLEMAAFVKLLLHQVKRHAMKVYPSR